MKITKVTCLKVEMCLGVKCLGRGKMLGISGFIYSTSIFLVFIMGHVLWVALGTQPQTKQKNSLLGI